MSELNAIRTQLPPAVRARNTYGRATTPAADMLLAELYLNDSVYTGTPDYADALTGRDECHWSPGYSLDPNYAHLIEADNKHVAGDRSSRSSRTATTPRRRAA